MFRTPILALAATTLIPLQATAEEALLPRHVAGPVTARIVRVVDGDTLLVDAEPWPQQSIRVYVRLRGVDAPELHARCADERRAAGEARAALDALVASDATVELYAVSGDKYFGRVLADARLGDGGDLASILLQRKLVRPYHGGRRSSAFCRQAG